VRDRQSGKTELVSVGVGGAPANSYSESPAISGDGRFVAFGSEASNLVPWDTMYSSDVFVRDRRTGKTELVSVAADGAPADGWSDSPSISADGRFVAFASGSDNLVPGDTNGRRDVFVAERQ
jgi:Tol biopolymer transport system component